MSLKEIALTQFEGAREIPASIDLLVKDGNKLDIQARSILIKLHAILTNFKVSKIAVGIGIKEFGVFNPILSFLHGDKKNNISYLGFDPVDHQLDSPVSREIMQNFSPENFLTTENEICRSLLQQDAFIVGVFSSKSVNEAREFIDAFAHDKSGALFLHNYSRLNSPSHHLYAAERNLRVIELPEGSGECYSIQMK